MNENRLNELLSDKDFVSELIKLDDPADVQAAFRREGVELSIEDIKKLGEWMAEGMTTCMEPLEHGELSLDQLDEVAGGILPAIPVLVVAGGIVAANPAVWVAAGAAVIGIGAAVGAAVRRWGW